METLLQDRPEILQGVNFDSRKFYPLSPDLWPVGGHELITPSDFDVEYFGRGTVRIKTGQSIIPTLAIKIWITGRRSHWTSGPCRKIRVKVEFLKDGEPSDFTGGWLFFTP